MTRRIVLSLAILIAVVWLCCQLADAGTVIMPQMWLPLVVG